MRSMLSKFLILLMMDVIYNVQIIMKIKRILMKEMVLLALYIGFWGKDCTQTYNDQYKKRMWVTR